MIRKIFIPLLILVTIFSSCRKNEDIYDTPTRPVKVTYEFLDLEWTLVGGYFYAEDMDTGTYRFYDHFGIKDTSTLNPFKGSALTFDDIIKGGTTWEFTSNGIFILNGVEEYTYDYYINGFKDEVYTPYRS